jgi:hypothetical protein
MKLLIRATERKAQRRAKLFCLAATGARLGLAITRVEAGRIECRGARAFAGIGLDRTICHARSGGRVGESQLA